MERGRNAVTNPSTDGPQPPSGLRPTRPDRDWWGRRQPLRLLAVVVVAGVVVAVVQAVQQRQWAVAAVLGAVAVLKRHPSAAWRIAVLGGATDRV